jgi:hypothetical protein
MAMESAFLLPFMLHMLLILGLYVWLSIARRIAVYRREADYDDFHRGDGDPDTTAAIARNLSNQFELPTVAWFTAVLLLAYGVVDTPDVVAAWVFLIGRIAHTAVQTLTRSVPLRGYVFLINALAVTYLAGHLGWLVLAGPPQ